MRERDLVAFVGKLVLLLSCLSPTESAADTERVVRKDQGISPAAMQVGIEEGEQEEKDQEAVQGFRFGSYGRVSVGSDLEGGTGRQVRLVAHPPRLLESSYAEIDLSYMQRAGEGGPGFHTQITLALGERLFHFSGDFTADIAMRNLYLEVSDVFTSGLSLWAGSRMYRGDDVYLLDFWPLDEQNTVGGGAAYRFDDTSIRLHVGFNRLDDKFQTEFITVPGQDNDTRQVLFMDRQRTIFTLRAEHHFPLARDLGLKTIAYGEMHSLPPGTYKAEDRDEERLPADFGWLLGAEFGLYRKGTSDHMNIFLKYGSGLGAYDELAVPFGLNREKKADGAKELVMALSGNYEPASLLGLLVGAYARYFVDADPNVYDRDDVWEVGAAFRPAWFVTEYFHLLAEVNFQYLRPSGLNPESLQQDKPFSVEAALMPAVTLGRGSYARPQLRIIYAVTWLNDSALRTYAEDDPLRKRPLRQFLGFSVEWWFNSSRYD